MADVETWKRELDRTRPSHGTLATMFVGFEQRIVELQARLAEVEAERQAEQETWRPVMADYLDERDRHVQTMKRAEAAEAERATLSAALAARGEGDQPAEWADCFDQYECHLRGCYADDVGVYGCAGKTALINYLRTSGEGDRG